MTSTLCSKTFTAFVLLILLTGIANSAETLHSIYLHTDNLNDFKQLTRRRAGGIGSATNLLAINELDLNITMEFMPLKRSLQLMDQQHPVCAINKVSNIQRLQKYLFSYPVNIFMNRMLYQTEDSAPLTQEVVSLAALFKERSKSQLLLTAQISYGAEVDAQLQQIPTKNKLYRNFVKSVRSSHCSIPSSYLKRMSDFYTDLIQLKVPRHTLLDTSCARKLMV